MQHFFTLYTSNVFSSASGHRYHRGTSGGEKSPFHTQKPISLLGEPLRRPLLRPPLAEGVHPGVMFGRKRLPSAETGGAHHFAGPRTRRAARAGILAQHVLPAADAGAVAAVGRRADGRREGSYNTRAGAIAAGQIAGALQGFKPKFLTGK